MKQPTQSDVDAITKRLKEKREAARKKEIEAAIILLKKNGYQVIKS